MKGYKGLADLLSFVASQVESQKSKSLDNVAGRAMKVALAVRNFKSIASLASDKVRAAHEHARTRACAHASTRARAHPLTRAPACGQVRFDEPDGGVQKASASAMKLQAIARGHSQRSLLKAAEKEAVEAPLSQMASLAKQAMYARVATARLKAPIQPKSRAGFAEYKRQAAQAAEAEEGVEAEEEAAEEAAAAAAEEAAGAASSPAASPAEPPAGAKALRTAKTSDPLPTTAALLGGRGDAAAAAPKAAKSAHNLARGRDESATDIQRVERGRSARRLLAAGGKSKKLATART